MALIEIDSVGVQAQTGNIDSSSDETIQEASSYVSRTNSHQSELDGMSRRSTGDLCATAGQAAVNAVEISSNLCIFLRNAAREMDETDRIQSMAFRHQQEV